MNYRIQLAIDTAYTFSLVIKSCAARYVIIVDITEMDFTIINKTIITFYKMFHNKLIFD